MLSLKKLLLEISPTTKVIPGKLPSIGGQRAHPIKGLPQPIEDDDFVGDKTTLDLSPELVRGALQANKAFLDGKMPSNQDANAYAKVMFYKMKGKEMPAELDPIFKSEWAVSFPSKPY